MSPLRPRYSVWSRFSVIVGLFFMTSLLCGCGKDGPELGQVRGVVTMDGKPLPGAAIVFIPQQGGRSAMGGTDENGEYTIQYSATDSGAIVGPVAVEIRTGIGEGKETIPPRYNTKTELTADVKSGKNDINFDLHSK